MKTYTVKQIADMLETNPETVRRWIRDKKLNAVQISRKDGNIITEDELHRFLNSTPKYAIRMNPLTISAGIISPALLISGIIGNKFAGYYNEKSQYDIGITSSEIEKYLKDNISNIENDIKQTKNSIEQLQNEVTKKEKELEKLKYLLESKYFKNK